MELLFYYNANQAYLNPKGVQFGGKYVFDFETDSNKIYFKENENYKSNFYSDESTLQNITAIVGENGSGKTTLLHAIFENSGPGVLMIFLEKENSIILSNDYGDISIEYEYEPIYKYDIQFSRKPYTPDFIIKQGDKIAYIEHFGITQDGKNKMYSDDQLEHYKKAIKDKIALHKQHGTTLIYTFSQYLDNRTLLEHLKENLESKGFVLVPRSNKEVMEKIISTEENRYIRKLVNLIRRFISNFKTNLSFVSLKLFGP